MRIAIIGTGLIGGSFGMALKAAQFEGELFAVGRNQANLSRALERGLVDRYETEYASLEEADVVLIAVPMLAVPAVLKSIEPHLSEHCIVTDAGSVKGSFVRDVKIHLTRLNRVVPGHPVAGSERSGVESGFAELYRGRRVLLTPIEQTDSDALETVTSLWTQTGAVVESMSVERHDHVLAATSHLPHMLAFGMVDSLFQFDDKDNILKYAAGGFRDFTRIAGSDPIMWRDICMTNSEALVGVMDQLLHDFHGLRDAIKDGDSVRIEQTFRNARRIRETYVDTIE